MMRISIIVSAFVFFFVLVVAAVLGWKHQQNAERQNSDAPSLVQENLAEESVYSSVHSPAGSAQPASFDEPGQQPPTAAMLKEIETIRRELGIQLFPNDRPGTDEEPSNQNFRNALISVVSNESGVSELGVPDLDVPKPIFANDQALPQSRPIPLQNQTTSLDAELIDELQAAVSALEERAASLEEMRHYDAADRTRRMAHELRKEIRTIQKEASQ